VLDNSTGTEIGQVMCFEVYQDHLYAASAIVDFSEEEINWTSYYFWIACSEKDTQRAPSTCIRTSMYSTLRLRVVLATTSPLDQR
jgi:hypothetical protein